MVAPHTRFPAAGLLAVLALAVAPARGAGSTQPDPGIPPPPAPQPPLPIAPGTPEPPPPRSAQVDDVDQPNPTRPVLPPAPHPLAPAWTAPADKALGGQIELGFAVELRVGSVLAIVGNDVVLPGTEGGLFVGYKADRLIVGLGFDVQRFVRERGDATNPPQKSAVTAMVFSPGLRLAVARTPDRRMELTGQLDLGLGVYSFSQGNAFGPGGPAMPSPQGSRFIWQVGPGLRYWLHPQMAMGVVSVLRGDSLSEEQGGLMMSTAVTGIVSAVQALGVF